MDLLSTVRKEGSRGGRGDFKWNDVTTSTHRENYLGHSVMAPVGRWQHGKDLGWYARNKNGADGGADAGLKLGETPEEKARRERKEEIRHIKEQEEDALARALGFDVPERRPEAGVGEEEVKRVVGGVLEDEGEGGEEGRGVGFGKLAVYTAQEGTKERLPTEYKTPNDPDHKAHNFKPQDRDRDSDRRDRRAGHRDRDSGRDRDGDRHRRRRRSHSRSRSRDRHRAQRRSRSPHPSHHHDTSESKRQRSSDRSSRPRRHNTSSPSRSPSRSPSPRPRSHHSRHSRRHGSPERDERRYRDRSREREERRERNRSRERYRRERSRGRYDRDGSRERRRDDTGEVERQKRRRERHSG